MEKILNFSEPLDVELLDRVVSCMASNNKQEINAAQKVLTQFQEHPDAWSRVSTILQQSKNQNTKFIGLNILSNAIKYRWNILPQTQRDGIKNFVVNTIITKSRDEQAMQLEKTLISKLNEVLVQIVKQEWPHNWRNFIPDLVASSKSSESLCENNMNIFRLLSEDVFDFSNGKMTQKKIKELKESFNNEFSLIYQLCEFVLERAKKPSLITATLKTLLRFLNWIPLSYIFETKLIEALVTKFLPVNVFRNEALRCLTEIANQEETKYDTKFEQMFVFSIKVLTSFLPVNSDFPKVYKHGSDYDQNFVQILALYLTTFCKKHLKLVEKEATKEQLLLAHNYLVEISKVDDTEVFKTCLEYWDFLAQDLFFTERAKAAQMQQNFGGLMISQPSRKQIYSQILSKVRTVMVSKMSRPEEVIIVEDDNGDIIKEYMKDVDAIQLYKSMKETLIFLTHLDYEDTEQIMVKKLENQVNGTEWSWHNLNTLCWAVGSISGAMDERDEKRFLVTVIKDLLGLCDLKKGKQNKAVVASNIMYVVGQYPRFLVAHWRFLKTVVNKLFEFMHEEFPGVQEMACETFLKIAKKCKRKFVIQHPNENSPFIEELLNDLPQIIADLEATHVHLFYEAVGFMISVADPEVRDILIKKLMDMPNNRWTAIVNAAAQRVEVLRDPETMKDLANLLKTNVAAAKSVGSPFISQIKTIYKDMLEFYKAYSQSISQEVAKVGAQVTRHSHVKSMRSIKKEILKLVETFIVNSKDEQIIVKHFMPPLLTATLGDYKNSVPDARDPGVLSLLTVAVNKLKEQILGDLPKILEYVLECTLPMITKNFEDFPDHRLFLFNLLRAINKHCFAAFFKIPPQGFKLIIDSVLWAIKHTHRDIYETGVKILLELLKNIEKLNQPQITASFYQSFYLPIMNDMLYVLTDTLHLSGFKHQAETLCVMFATVQKLPSPIYDQSKYPRGISNVDFLKEYINQLLTKSFPNLSAHQIQQFIIGLFQLSNDLPTFKNHLRDFLVQMKEFSPQETNDLFFEQRKQQQLQQKQKMQQVPGLAHQDAEFD